MSHKRAKRERRLQKLYSVNARKSKVLANPRELMDNPGAISDMVYKSEAYQSSIKLRTLDTNVFVFGKNYEELKNIIQHFSSEEHHHLLWDNDQSQIVIRHVIRLFVNFLASAKMLVDHTRILIKEWYSSHLFYHLYQKEIAARFIDNPLSAFIEDLRNYALHYSYPVSSLQMSFENVEGDHRVRVRFLIEKSDLNKWSSWNKGKRFLSSAEDKISIEPIIDEYYNQVLSFHKWMLEKLQEIHADELKWLDDMGRRVDELIGRIPRKASNP